MIAMNSNSLLFQTRIVRSALITACQVGNPKLLETMLEEDPDLSPDETGRTALHVLASVEEFTEDHARCWKILSSRINVNLGDEAGRTALHLAARVEDSPAVEIILKSGACIFQTDKTGAPAFQDISFDVLKKFLDTSVEKQKDTGEYYFDLKFLNPNRELDKKEKEDTSFLEGSASKCLPEMKQILLLAKSDSAKLLNHPTFKAFVAHKWKLVKPFYYAELFLSVLFCGCLTMYINFASSNCDQSTVFLAFLRTLLIFFLVIIYFLTVVACIASPLFFSKPRRLFDFLLTVFATIVAAWGHYSSDSPWNRLYLVVSTTTILLAALHFWLIIGSHPKLASPFFLARRLLLGCIKILAMYFIAFFALAITFSILSRGCRSSDCSSVFFGGITFEVPFVRSGKGHSIEQTGQLPFVLFFIATLTALMHLIGFTIIVSQKTHKNSELHRLRALVELITKMEKKLVEAPLNCQNLLRKRTPLKISTPEFLKKVAHRILFFPSNGDCLRLESRKGNIITTFNSGKAKSAWWDEPAKLSPKIVGELNEIIKRRHVIREKPRDQKELQISTLLEKTEIVLDRMRLTSVVLEKLENKSKEVENLLIQSLRINGLRDQHL